MVSAAVVLACVLNVLGRAPNTLPPIEFVAIRPPGLPADVDAFVRVGSGVISLLTTSDAFQTLQRLDCRAWAPLRTLAALTCLPFFGPAEA
jgi:hypothetical protein